MSRRWLAMALVALAAYGGLAGVAEFTEIEKPSSEPSLRWGGDKIGGGPYIYQDAYGSLTGFEVDLAAYLAQQLNLRSEFVQGSWDKLPAQLSRGDFDMVLNGYEWSPEREEMWASTIPYYVYRLQLLTREDDNSIQSWDNLRLRPGRAASVLVSSADRRPSCYVSKEYGQDVELLSYSEGVTSAMELVQDGQLDATVQDVPVAIHYRSEFPDLHAVGNPVAPGYYVIFVRRQDNELRERLNEAIRRAIKDNKLRDL